MNLNSFQKNSSLFEIDFRQTNFKDPLFLKLFAAFPFSHSLRILRCSEACDEVVFDFLRFCVNLEILDLEKSFEVTKKSLDFIVQFCGRNLRRLDLRGSQIDALMINDLLKHPHLNHLFIRL